MTTNFSHATDAKVNVSASSTGASISGHQYSDSTCGVYDLAKDASTFNPGDKVYWDNVNLVATSAPPASPSTTPGNREICVADLVQASGVNAPGRLTGDPRFGFTSSSPRVRPSAETTIPQLDPQSPLPRSAATETAILRDPAIGSAGSACLLE